MSLKSILAVCVVMACADAFCESKTIKKRQAAYIPREWPAEWNSLVAGAQFIERFAPLPDLGCMTSDTWGGTNVVPRDINNGIQSTQWDYWGGNTRLLDDGKYHLIVCRWLQDLTRDESGHVHNPNPELPYSFSRIAHAISDTPYGPFKFQSEIGQGHNVEWYVTDEGKYVIYVIDTCYLSDSIYGPWKKTKLIYESRDRTDVTGRMNYLHNCTFAKREDGSFLMINRHGHAWFSQTGISPYYRVSSKTNYPEILAKFEDPVVWRTDVQYHMIVNDWQGRIAYHLRSKDGVDWKLEPGAAYIPGKISYYENGLREDWYKYERIKVFQDQYGRPTAANFAVSDVIKYTNLPNDNHGYKMTCVPLVPGRLIQLENRYSLMESKELIRVRIKAEPGFNPHTDMDLGSLRFGAADKVNYGRGCRLKKTEKDGADLIVFFDRIGHGFDKSHFAGKLLGKTAEGKLLFGWCRLPGVKYIEPILSSRQPVWAKDAVAVEVQNFGQAASVAGTVEIEVSGQLIAAGTVPPLKPFETITLTLDCLQRPADGQTLSVRTLTPGRAPEVMCFKMEE